LRYGRTRRCRRGKESWDQGPSGSPPRRDERRRGTTGHQRVGPELYGREWNEGRGGKSGVTGSVRRSTFCGREAEHCDGAPLFLCRELPWFPLRAGLRSRPAFHIVHRMHAKKTVGPPEFAFCSSSTPKNQLELRARRRRPGFFIGCKMSLVRLCNSAVTNDVCNNEGGEDYLRRRNGLGCTSAILRVACVQQCLALETGLWYKPSSAL
jgi:hypothetical protein